MKKNIKPVLLSGALTLTTAKAARDEFKGGYKNETKRHKIERYLVGTGSAIGIRINRLLLIHRHQNIRQFRSIPIMLRINDCIFQ